MNVQAEYRYNRLTWEQMNEAITMGKVVVLPTGSTEQHGKHLPLDTDIGLDIVRVSLQIPVIIGLPSSKDRQSRLRCSEPIILRNDSKLWRRIPRNRFLRSETTVRHLA